MHRDLRESAGLGSIFTNNSSESINAALEKGRLQGASMARLQACNYYCITPHRTGGLGSVSTFISPSIQTAK